MCSLSKKTKVVNLLIRLIHLLLVSSVFAKDVLIIGKELTCPPCSCIQAYEKNIIEMNCANRSIEDQALPLPPNESVDIPTHILFDNNSISTITSSKLANYTDFYISLLSFHNNTLTNITNDAFSGMKNLQILDLSYNNISELILKEAFHGIANTSLKSLNLSAVSLRNMSEDFFLPLEDIRNFSLSIQNTTTDTFPMEQLMSLNYLESLDLGANVLTLKSFNVSNASFPFLKRLILDNNKFFEFPAFCFKNDNNSRFPILQTLSIQWNSMRYLDESNYGCLKTLEYFYLNGNLFEVLRTNQFAMLPNLYKITLSYVGCAMNKVERAVFNNSALRQIFFRENHIWFRKAEVDLRIFEGCTNLELLNLNENIFQVTKQEEFKTLLQNLTTLKTLVMGGCALSFIPSVITEDLVNISSLALYQNSITDLGEHTFENLTQLKKLFMANNKITAIRKNSLPVSFVDTVEDVEFFGNPFSCTCDLLWFLKWMATKKEAFKLWRKSFDEKYKCASPDNLNGHYLIDLDFSEASCMLDQGEKIITLTASILLIVFLVVGSGLYRFRWHIRYLIYMIRYSQRQDLDTRHYEYDAFVAYSSEDRRWVIKTLLPVIETKESLKLCVHDRDFEVGNLIVDNIVDGVEKSRKIMIVLSNNFAKSDWCQFELNLIQRHVLENGQRLLVVVLLEEIDSRHVTKAMRVMLQTTTYLLWGEEDYARKAFFNRLRLLLQRPLQRGKERRLSV